MSSWYAGDGNAYHSPFETVNTGDQIQGLIDNSGGPAGYWWMVQWYDVTKGTSGILPVGGGIFETNAFVTLEAHQLSACNQYPNTYYYGVPFTSLSDQGGYYSGQWSTQIQINDGCGEFVSASNSYVNLGIW